MSFGKSEFDGLVGLGEAGTAIEGHPAGFHMYLLRDCSWAFRGPLRILCALQIELYRTAAYDALPVFFVFATTRVDRVVPHTGVSKDRNGHVFHQAGGLALKVCGFQRLDRKNLLIALYLRKSQPARKPRHVLGRWWRRFFLFLVRHPLSL